MPLCRPIEAFSIVCAILLSLGVVSLAEGLVKGDMTGIMGFGLALYVMLASKMWFWEMDSGLSLARGSEHSQQE